MGNIYYQVVSLKRRFVHLEKLSIRHSNYQKQPLVFTDKAKIKN